jgi:hypothetical protein
MICPICERDLEIVEREVDSFEDDSSGIVKYAVCMDCRKQWKLKNATDSRRRKNKSAEGSNDAIKVVGEDKQATPPDLVSLLNAAKANQTASQEERFASEYRQLSLGQEYGDRMADDYENPAKSRSRNSGDDKTRQRQRRASPNVKGAPNQRQRKTPRDSEERIGKQQRNLPRDDNRPRQKQRTSPNQVRDKPVGRQRSTSRQEVAKAGGRERNLSRQEVATAGGREWNPSRQREERTENEQNNEVLFKPVRMVLAILSILAFLYLGFRGYFTYYLDYAISRGELSSTVAVFILGLFCLIAGIFLLLTLKKDGVVPLFIPSFLYLIGGVIAFFLRGGSRLLLSGAIIALIVAIVMIILVLLDKVKDVDD